MVHKLVGFSLILLILFLSSVSSANECTGTITQDDIPCLIFLDNNASSKDCNLINISIFRNSTFIFNTTMENFTRFICNDTFNESGLGTYVISYTTGDTGSFTIVEGKRMILLLYFAAAIIVFLILHGLTQENITTMTLAAIGLMIMGVFIHANGFNTLNNLITEYLAIIFIMGGLLFLIPLFEWAMDEMNLLSG